MDIFNGNKKLEERLFNTLNWGVYLRDTSKGKLMPFIFLYKDNERVKIINFQEDEDNYLRGIEILKKSKEDFDQYFIGYEAQMILDETQKPINTIIIKGFDKRQEKGIFIVQKFQITNDNFSKIGNPAILDMIPMELESISVENPDFSTPQIGFNVLNIKENGKIKVAGLIRHHCEFKISNSIKQFLESNLNNFEKDNLSGNFDIDIQYNEKIRKGFLSYLIKDAFYSVIHSDLVHNKFTSKGIGISINVEFNNEVIYKESTNDAVKEISELIDIMGNVNKEKHLESKNKKWWEFWK
jgi:hypothetical protein